VKFAERRRDRLEAHMKSKHGTDLKGNLLNGEGGNE